MSGTKGKSGRKKKTDAEKMILGVKKDRIGSVLVPSRIEERVVAFNWLGEVGKTIFNHFEPMLHNNGTLSAGDAIMFNLLCERFQSWFKAWTECNERGKYIPIKDKIGNTVDVKIAPWAKMETVYYDQLCRACREFGLTPISRSSVEKIVREGKLNPFEAIT